MKQVTIRDSFAFRILDVALRICLLLVFSFFHEIVKLPTDKEQIHGFTLSEVFIFSWLRHLAAL